MSPARIVAVTRLVIAVMEDLSDQDMDLLSAAEADFAALLIPHLEDLRMIHSLAVREMNTAIVGHHGLRCWIGELITPVFNGRGISPGDPMGGVECAIWAAPHNWPHGGDTQSDLDMLQETVDFTRFLQACRTAAVPRIIYCSSMNVTYHEYGVNPDYYRGFDPVLNFFTQGKIACEGLLRAYAKCVEGASCTTLRLGWYPGEETTRHDLNRIRMTNADVLDWFHNAAKADAGFHVTQMSRGKW